MARSFTCGPMAGLLQSAPMTVIYRPSIIIDVRYFSQRPSWIVKDSRSIQEVLDNATEQIESGELTARTAAAVWSTIPRLLSKSKGERNSKRREKEIMECELQIFNILEVVINSLDVLNPRELTPIILGMAKIVQNVQSWPSPE